MSQVTILRYTLTSAVAVALALPSLSATVTLTATSAMAGRPRAPIVEFKTVAPYLAEGATITWTIIGSADGSPIPPPLSASEMKFNPGPSGKPFLGIFGTVTGVLGSTSVAAGAGASYTTIPKQTGVKTYKAWFTVDAFGFLGAPAGGSFPSWNATSTGKDPWVFDSDYFSSLPDSDFDMYIPFTINGGSIEPASSTGVGAISGEVNVETFDFNKQLLSFYIDGSGTHVHTSSETTLYQLTEEDNWTLDSSRIVTNSQLESLLKPSPAGDISSGPIYLGVLGSSLLKPTMAMDDGYFAHVGINGQAMAGEVVPEPTVILAFCTGLLFLVRRRR